MLRQLGFDLIETRDNLGMAAVRDPDVAGVDHVAKDDADVVGFAAGAGGGHDPRWSLATSRIRSFPMLTDHYS